MTLDKGRYVAQADHCDVAVQINHLRDATTTREQFIREVVPLYLEHPVEVARICDEEIDRRGHLLGYVREAARAARAEKEGGR